MATTGFAILETRTEERDELSVLSKKKKTGEKVSHQRFSSSNFNKLKADKKSFEYVKGLHFNWYLHALKALFGQLGKQLYQMLPQEERLLLATCLDGITDELDLVAGARCLVEARARLQKQKKKSSLINSLGEMVLPERDSKLLSRRRRSPYRLVTSHALKSDSIIMDVKQVRSQPALIDPKLSPIQKVTKLVRILYHGTEQTGSWITTYNRILEFKKKLDEGTKSPGAKVYQLRLYDLVFGHNHPAKRKRKDGTDKTKDLFTRAYDFVNTNLFQRHERNFNFKLLSPRLMPVMPDKMKAKERFLSPSVLSFYNDDSSDSIAALPKMLEKTELSEKDREAVLEMIMDVSGAKRAVELAMELFNNRDLYGLEGEFFEVTERLTNVFKQLEKTFSKQQSKEMNNKGYTFLEVKQYRMVLTAHGVNNTKDVEVDLDRYEQLDRRKREGALWDCIEAIARNDSEDTYYARALVHQFQDRRRGKRESISVFSPVVLSPYMFSPVFGLTIVGPVVLSPNIFSPLVFNPSIIGPFVMNPAIAMPFLISPYILSPYVMTPIIMAPFVLNPYILSPNVLNPYVLSPLILSPYVFCPEVLSPQTLGGAFLSPNVFSPAIGSESFLMASLLSPSWMS